MYIQILARFFYLSFLFVVSNNIFCSCVLFCSSLKYSNCHYYCRRGRVAEFMYVIEYSIRLQTKYLSIINPRRSTQSNQKKQTSNISKQPHHSYHILHFMKKTTVNNFEILIIWTYIFLNYNIFNFIFYILIRCERNQ